MKAMILVVALSCAVALTSAGIPCAIVTAGRGKCYAEKCPNGLTPSPHVNPEICGDNSRRYYKHVCCEDIRQIKTPTDPWYPTNPSSGVDNICGISKTQRILGGTRSRDCAWPWMVSIRGNVQGSGYTTYENSLPLCSGVLIDRKWVLTSAYCPLLAGLGNGAVDITRNILVVAGENNIDIRETNPTTRLQQEQTIHVDKYFHHPIFKYSKPTGGYNQLLNLNGNELSSFNVALLKLSQDVVFDECRKPVCLPKLKSTASFNPNGRNYNSYNYNRDYNYNNNNNNINNNNIYNGIFNYNNKGYNSNPTAKSDDGECIPKNCFIAGWGLYDNTTFSSNLLETRVKLFDSEVCDALSRFTGRVRPQGTTCAAPVTRGNVPCAGDNGGMLVCSKSGRWTLHGIISKSFVDCDTNKLITVADVNNDQIRAWIEYIRETNRN